jgi:hypothetical protein
MGDNSPHLLLLVLLGDVVMGQGLTVIAGSGLFLFERHKNPHPNPLPEYMERGQDKNNK